MSALQEQGKELHQWHLLSCNGLKAARAVDNWSGNVSSDRRSVPYCIPHCTYVH